MTYRSWRYLGDTFHDDCHAGGFSTTQQVISGEGGV